MLNFESLKNRPMLEKIVNFALRRPKFVFGITFALTFFALLQFFRVKIDTDPENMLPADEPVRVFNHEFKKEFSIYDYIVLGIVKEKDPDGVFNPVSLEKIYKLTEEIKKIDGVISYEIISLANKDDIEQQGAGTVSFRWLMGNPPYSKEEALRIKERAMENPLFYNTLFSPDGKAACIFIPIKDKKLSYRIAEKIKSILKNFKGEESYYLTGLPLAEDAFGVQMFWQMGISAPLAFLVIFILMLWFFKNVRLVALTLVMAVVVVIVTLGLLVGLGFPIHIMSSMIPIFLFPISVLNSIHYLSEFFENYQNFKDKIKTILYVVKKLYSPTLFASLTTMAGFISLSFTPIPPVQVFGIFVAIGVGISWILTIFFLCSYISLIDEKKISKFGIEKDALENTFLSRILFKWGDFALKRWKEILLSAIVIAAVSVYGILRIEINDNPTRWFKKSHPIRISDMILNRHFGGTYSAYLIVEAHDTDKEIFKEPEMLKYVEGLVNYLKDKTGKTTSILDIVKKVHYELLGGDKKYNVVPATKKAVAQTLLSFENSHKPDDLWHFVTPDYSKINIWLQLTSGDNKDMARVVKAVDSYFKDNQPPFPISYKWAGLTYINMVWQNKMVVGMLINFLGSFLIVLYMMTFLFRSPLTGLVSMIPLILTILFIYSLLGFIGRNYDMPVAVLSALTLGLAIDFSIHFLERLRLLYEEKKDQLVALKENFGSPARALVRNGLVISIGFLPLFASNLVPYNTVGFFMFMIMLVAGIVTITILPALIRRFPKVVFEEKTLFSCRNCILISLIVSFTLVYVLLGYNLTRINTAMLIALVCLIFLSGLCSFVSKKRKV